ncbi:MAG: RNA polymerase sigma factor [Defluviitaleaceae bacterium]|nr:RNA polymerase sigma factor [Defluviitaleaceae bacterium]
METESAAVVSGEELYLSYLAGSKNAFEDFVKLYEKELSRFIYGIVRDYHEAEHLMIETFAQLVINSKKFDGKSSIKTYLFAIGKNLSLQLLRKRGREQHISFEEAAEISIGEEETPHGMYEKSLNKQYLHETIKELKSEYHAVLVLLYFQDMSYLHAGKAMNKSEKQIKALAHRAKAALKKKLESKGFVYA